MADHMAPKKKHEYFGRGRGIADLSLYDQDQSDSSSCSPRPSSYDASPSGGSGSTRQSSPASSSPFDYSTSVSPPPPIPPPSALPFAAAASAQPPLYTPYHDYHHPPGPAAPGIGIGAQYPPEIPEPSVSHYGTGGASAYPPPSQPHFIPSGSHRLMGEGSECYNGEIPPTYSLEDDSQDSQQRGLSKVSNPKGQKRAQRCRMCANHNKKVDMKGHKWYCPFRDCTCNDCEITRKTQYYMKERQKLTRHQQQQQQDERGGYGAQGMTPEPSRRRVSVDQSRMDFPRVDEMVKETEDILDYNLFDKVNQACRPRSSNLPN